MSVSAHPRHRLNLGMRAQTYGQVVQLLIRFGEVPLLLHFWGAQLYGEWLMLVAMPAYLAIGDGGFASAAGREMSMRSGAGDQTGALAVFQSTAWLLCLVSLALFLSTLALLQFAPLNDWLGFQQINAEQLKFVLLALVAYVLVGFQGGLINGGFWCSGSYPLGMTLASTTELIEFTALAAVVGLGGGPVHAAFAYLAGRSAGTLISRLALKRATPWLHYGIDSASLSEIRRLASPAFASLAFPLGNALNIEGMRLIVGLALGPAAVAIFTPLRTLSNLTTRPRFVINRLIEPELSFAFGSGNHELFCRLFLRSCQTAIWLSAMVGVGLLLVGPRLWSFWTLGQAEFHWPLFLLLLIAALINSAWYTALMVPYATNRHGGIAVIYVCVYGMCTLAVSYFAIRAIGLSGAGFSLLMAEAAMAACVLPIALRMGRQRWRVWLSATFRPPTFVLAQSARLCSMLSKRSTHVKS